jgi:hypothetical protein
MVGWRGGRRRGRRTVLGVRTRVSHVTNKNIIK